MLEELAEILIGCSQEIGDRNKAVSVLNAINHVLETLERMAAGFESLTEDLASEEILTNCKTND